MKKLVIFGAGSFARVAQFYFCNDSPMEVAAFTVHENFLSETPSASLCGLPLVPFETVERRFPPDDFDMFIAVGFKRLNRIRAEIYGQAKAKGYRLRTYLSSKAVYFGEVACGDNCFILENNVIQPFSRLGDDVILWSGNHIGHDVLIGDHCFVSSHVVLSGHVRVGDFSFIGVNACAKQGITIGAGCLIGSGAVLLKDTRPGEAYLAQGTTASAVSAERIAAFL